MKLLRTDIADVVIIEPQVFSDERGWFMESFSEARFHIELGKAATCWNDPELDIQWPSLELLIINQKERSAPSFSASVRGTN